MSDPILDFKINQYRSILERQIRVCQRFMDEAEAERNEIGHRFARAQLKQTEYLLEKFRAVFDPVEFPAALDAEGKE